ncbi:MAG: FAD binding domain-containing protein [Pseudomonadota bacterium]
MSPSLAPCQLFEPRSLRGALKLLRDEGPLVPVAGCTDVYAAASAGILAARRFLSLWNLKTLARIDTTRAGTIRIGALATFAQLIRSPILQQRLPMLVAAARQIGGPQIRNRGTIGGNVASGSPAGDTLPVLAAAEAQVALLSAAGERRVPFVGFYTGYRQSVLRPDEIIGGFEIPPIEGRQWFRKVGSRAALTISKVVVAGIRTTEKPRIALGSVAATVVRAPRTEAALAAGATAAEAMPILASEITPVDDLRSTAEYRRRVAMNLLGRFWKDTEDDRGQRT